MRPRGSSGPESPRRAVLVYCCVRARRVCRTRPEGLQGDVTPSPDVILPVAGGGVYRCAGTAGTRQGAGAQTASWGDTTPQPALLRHGYRSSWWPHPRGRGAPARYGCRSLLGPCGPAGIAPMRVSPNGRLAGRFVRIILTNWGESISRTSQYRNSSADEILRNTARSIRNATRTSPERRLSLNGMSRKLV